MKLLRVMVAFFSAIFLPAIAVALLRSNGDFVLMFVGTLFLAFWAGLFGLPLAVPAYFLFRKLNWLSFWQVELGSLLVGFAAFLVFSWGSPGVIIDALHSWSLPTVFLVYASISGALFWVLAIRLSANYSFKPNPLRSFKTPSGSSGGSA